MAIRFASALDMLRAEQERQAEAARLAEKMVANEMAVKAAKVANKHGQYADKDKRRAYMREFMRAKRAAAQET